ncbi:MAG: TRAP transporter small permease [Candidatus Accumulibacter sp.]|jgi:TRAP-type C4-dicarboxylate transport system permease small subunit|nr:TRAP transporter small permease [Accumulibacter sp.]
MKKAGVIGKLASFEDALSVLIVCVISFAVFVQVLSRFVLKAPLSWTEELSRFALIWLTFIAASVALREGGHFVVDLVSRRLPPGPRKYYHKLILLVELVFVTVLFYTGYQIVPVAHMQESAALDIHMSYVYLAIPCGAALMMINTLIKLFGKSGAEDHGEPS